MKWTGVFTALITPFGPDQKGVQVETLEKLLAQQAQAQVTGVIIGGSTGEGQCLELEEIQTALRVAKKFQPRMKILGACGFSSTEATAQRYRWLCEQGVDGVLVSTPPYNKPPQRGLIRHFQEISRQGDTPIIVYNIPGRTAVNLLPATLKEIAQLPNVVAVKESSGSLEQIAQVKEILPSTVSLLSGDDPLNLPIWSLGGIGTVSVLSNAVPHLVVRLWNLWTNQKIKEAQELQSKLTPLIQALFVESNPIPTKYLVGHLVGTSLWPRLPLMPLEESLQGKILEAYRSVESL